MYDSDFLHQIINNERIKYLSYITKCMVSEGHVYKEVYTVKYCVNKIRRIDEMEAIMLGQPVEYTHDEESLLELKEYYT